LFAAISACIGKEYKEVFHMKYVGAIAGRILLGSAFVLFSIISMAQSYRSAAGQQGSMQGQGQGQEGSMNQSQNSMKQSAGTTMSSDQKFVKEAAEGGLAEVELGQMAEQKASSEQVKQFAQRMVNDHSKANDQLKQIASSEGITVPDKLNAKDKMLKAKLSKLSGDKFDHVYMENMVKDHEKDISDFQKESSNGTNPQVKQFASQTLPTLQSHLQEAQSIAPNTKMSRNNMSPSGTMQK
jgi:putative membrane protein